MMFSKVDLPDSAGTDDGQELPPRHVEIDPTQCDHARVGDPVDLEHVPEPDQRVLITRTVELGAHLVLHAHSASPRSTPVTELRSNERIESTSATLEASAIATTTPASIRQSITSTGTG